MIKKSLLIIFLTIGLIIVGQMGFAQDEKTDLQESVKNAGTVTWKDARHETVENHGIDYKGCILILTKTIKEKTGGDNKLVAEIPLDQIDTNRIESHEHMTNPGIYYMGFYTKNDEKSIKVTRFHNGTADEEIVMTHFFSIYSKGETKHKTLIDNFKKLVAKCVK